MEAEVEVESGVLNPRNLHLNYPNIFPLSNEWFDFVLSSGSISGWTEEDTKTDLLNRVVASYIYIEDSNQGVESSNSYFASNLPSDPRSSPRSSKRQSKHNPVSPLKKTEKSLDYCRPAVGSNSSLFAIEVEDIADFESKVGIEEETVGRLLAAASNGAAKVAKGASQNQSHVNLGAFMKKVQSSELMGLDAPDSYASSGFSDTESFTKRQSKTFSDNNENGTMEDLLKVSSINLADAVQPFSVGTSATGAQARYVSSLRQKINESSPLSLSTESARALAPSNDFGCFRTTLTAWKKRRALIQSITSEPSKHEAHNSAPTVTINLMRPKSCAKWAQKRPTESLSLPSLIRNNSAINSDYPSNYLMERILTPPFKGRSSALDRYSERQRLADEITTAQRGSHSKLVITSRKLKRSPSSTSTAAKLSLPERDFKKEITKMRKHAE